MNSAGVRAILLLLIALTPLHALPLYFVTDLGTLGGSASAGNALNQSGQVTGAANLEDDMRQVAFLSAPDGAQPLVNIGTLGGSDSFGQAVTSLGEVAGSSKIDDDILFHAFLTGPNGEGAMDLGTLGGSSSYAFGVNGAGQVTGQSLISGNSATRAYLTGARGDMMRDLGTLPGGSSSFGQGVNASGQVTGYSGTSDGFNHAFISDVDGGELRDLGTLGGAFSFGIALNDAGQVTGRSAVATIGQHAFRSGPNGGPLLDLGTLGGFSSFGQAINNNGDVVGYSYLGDNSTQHAFLYTTTTGLLDLNGHLLAGSGWTLTEARGINDRGQITGVGMKGGSIHAFLLTLIPNQLRITSVTRLENGHVLVKGEGTPSQNYIVEVANTPQSGFTQVAMLTAGNDGSLEFEDIDAPAFPRRFYRFVAP